MELTAVIRKGERQYVALCPEIDVVSQGKTADLALANLQEAVELYVEEMGVPSDMTPAIVKRITVSGVKTPASIR